MQLGLTIYGRRSHIVWSQTDRQHNIKLLIARRKAEALRDDAVHPFVCSSVRLLIRWFIAWKYPA